MLKLFKNKSLKNNTKTEQGVSVQGAGVGKSGQDTRVSASVQGADNKNARKQSGRSMVEMLGVLAIIGVLSIGGIQGYTIAMRKHHANEILNVVNKYALILYYSCQSAIEKGIPTKFDLPDGCKTDPDSWANDPSYCQQTISPDTVFSEIDENNSWWCPGIRFEEAGLGQMPNGIMQIGWSDANIDTMVNPNNYSMREGDQGGVSIKSLSSGDAIVISVRFETKELCETLLNITGKPIVQGGATLGADNGLVNDVCVGRLFEGYNLAITTMVN